MRCTTHCKGIGILSLPILASFIALSVLASCYNTKRNMHKVTRAAGLNPVGKKSHGLLLQAASQERSGSSAYLFWGDRRYF